MTSLHFGMTRLEPVELLIGAGDNRHYFATIAALLHPLYVHLNDVRPYFISPWRISWTQNKLNKLLSNSFLARK